VAASPRGVSVWAAGAGGADGCRDQRSAHGGVGGDQQLPGCSVSARRNGEQVGTPGLGRCRLRPGYHDRGIRWAEAAETKKRCETASAYFAADHVALRARRGHCEACCQRNELSLLKLVFALPRGHQNSSILTGGSHTAELFAQVEVVFASNPRAPAARAPAAAGALRFRLHHGRPVRR
jgi:hypothetical protein